MEKCKEIKVKLELTDGGGTESGPTVDDVPVSFDLSFSDAVSEEHDIGLLLINVNVLEVSSGLNVYHESCGARVRSCL